MLVRRTSMEQRWSAVTSHELSSTTKAQQGRVPYDVVLTRGTHVIESHAATCYG